MTLKKLMSIDDVAEQTPWGRDTIRKAIRSTDPSSFPPPLKAKQGPRGQYVVRREDFEAWVDGLVDA